MHDPKKEKGHQHPDAEVGDQFPQHQSPPAEWTYEKLFKCAALLFPHHRHRSGEGRADLQDDADHARDEKVRAPHRRVVEHLRANLDRHGTAAAFLQKDLG